MPTPVWLRATFSAPWQRIWYEGDSVNLSIGQGFLTATPLQLAVAYSALANGGMVVRPHQENYGTTTILERYMEEAMAGAGYHCAGGSLERVPLLHG